VTPTPGGGFRADAYPGDGRPAGSDLALMQRQHLDEHNIEFGVCTGVMYASSMQGWPGFATALAAAYNDWTIETFLDKEPRLRGSIQVAHQDPASAAREIDRLGGHPQVVQVFVHTVSDGGHKPLGDPFYRPII
jgi:predicted TIM-barrel fold metal-dependent hydrolase